ncbi:MAG: KH domain-containing protein [Nanoarchaeota archaeon]|nr:KH domain-containing protein [Nanoarchaeota archaeon]
MATLDMQLMRYINLLDRAANVKTNKCFVHNNAIFFAVSDKDISRAIGPAAVNIRRMQEQLGKRVRIIKKSDGVEDIKRFIEDIVTPVKVKAVEIKDNCVIITAGNSQNKAVLIGRNRRRYEELKKVIQDYYNMDLKIV